MHVNEVKDVMVENIERVLQTAPPPPHTLCTHTPQVNEVKDVMVENIEKVLERGERIELLVDKADGLCNQVGWCVRT